VKWPCDIHIYIYKFTKADWHGSAVIMVADAGAYNGDVAGDETAAIRRAETTAVTVERRRQR
jgi:hypothetical protein